ncbi:rhophilin-2-B [Daktulosphaira vitifoliae]|uniref:rhophilin-2-B n=1 Tax=Daktulosphaira vitifoliae TaxID=58002 RepID=UPI0021AADAE4|nr:rhophilin-2-B [Daktulosphaira vitifoliae]
MAHTAVLRSQNRAISKGTDPKVATCRGKLQNKRSVLNQEINKELKLRAGAENLLRATKNRKLKETVALELSFMNSNLQLLKDEMAQLNSSVEIYQDDSAEHIMPMIPLSLKETKDIDFKSSFQNFISEHYSEDSRLYEEAISEFTKLRQDIQFPKRDNSGISLLIQYFNQLYYVERRFFPPDRSMGIYFEWYDSLTGIPSCQKTVAFEKACVLFNVAAIYTQMGAKQNRLTEKGLDQAIACFLKAAGTYTYIQETFVNAPSMDLSSNMMTLLVKVMMAQAQECLFEKLELQVHNKTDYDLSMDLGQEAALVSEMYANIYSLMPLEGIGGYIPDTWVSLFQVKKEHYAALSYHYTGIGVWEVPLNSTKHSSSNRRRSHNLDSKSSSSSPPTITDENRKQLGKALLKLSVLFHEEALRIQRLCRELRTKNGLADVLKSAMAITMDVLNDEGSLESEDDDFYCDTIETPVIEPCSKFQLSLTPPDFGSLPAEDLFSNLGPVAVFSAKHHWTAPKILKLKKTGYRSTSHNNGGGHTNGGSFGFSVRGDAPVTIKDVEPGSIAQYAGMKEGDLIVGIGDEDVKWAKSDHVAKLIKHFQDSLVLKVVTPINRDSNKYTNKQNLLNSKNLINNKSNSVNDVSPRNSLLRKKIWNPFRK